jgi:hypothetical protein
MRHAWDQPEVQYIWDACITNAALGVYTIFSGGAVWTALCPHCDNAGIAGFQK